MRLPRRFPGGRHAIIETITYGATQQRKESDDDDDAWMLQYAVSDYERHFVSERVIFEPDADSVQIRILYPFRIPPETLPFAQAYVSTEAFGMRFAQVKLDSDGEIICNYTIPYRIGDPFPEGVFVDLLELTARAGLSQ